MVNRPGLRATFSEKYLAVFANFEDVLEQVQNLYETQKVHILSKKPLPTNEVYLPQVARGREANQVS